MELIKNLTLKGISELCIHIPADAKAIKSSSVGSIFPCQLEDMLISASALNPSVNLKIVSEISFDFHAVIVCDYWNEASVSKIALDCRKQSVPFIAEFSSGLLACLISDLGDNYEYRHEAKKSLVDGTVETVVTQKTQLFSPFATSFSKDAPILSTLKAQLAADEALGGFTPVCAIISALVAQEIVKIVTRKDTPILNLLTFNGENLEAQMFI